MRKRATGRGHETAPVRHTTEDVLRFADMFAAIGVEARLRILRLLLSAHPTGMVAGEIQAALDIPNSTLSHHLDRLRRERLVTVTREGTYLRYAVNTGTLRDLLGFLYAECCTRSSAVSPQEVAWIGNPVKKDR